MTEREIRKYVKIFGESNSNIELDDIDLELLIHSLLDAEFAENMLGEFNPHIQEIFDMISKWMRKRKIDAVLQLED